MNLFCELIFLFRNKWHLFLLGAILIIAAFLRFYNTPARYGFDPDATRDALISIEGARHLRLPLAGPISSIGSFRFGPWYYYQLIFFKMIVPLDYSPWIYVGLTSVASVFILYKIGELLENKSFGLLLAGVMAVSRGQIVWATGLSNPDLVLVTEVFAIWIFIKILKNNLSYWYTFFLGISLGIGINNHYQMIGLLVLPLFIFKKNKIFFTFLTIGLGIFITFIPLILFDYLNHWETAQAIIYYLFQGKNNIYVPNSWKLYMGDFMPAYWAYVLGVSNFVGGIIMVVCFCFMIGILTVKKLSKEMKALFITFLFQLIALRYFSGERQYYYFQYLQPFIFLLLAYVLWTMTKAKYGKYICTSLCLVLLVLIAPNDAVQLHPMEYHVEYNNQMQALVENYPNKRFLLYSCSKSIGRADAIAFLLDNMKKLGDDGVKIGFLHETCKLLASRNIKIDTVVFPNRMFKKYKFLDRINAVDLTSISNVQLLNAGWHLETPKTVFDRTTQ